MPTKFSKELLWLFGLIFILTVTLQFLNIYILDHILSYNRDKLITYQILWQWITPNLVHLNWMHWLLNILNLFVLMFIFQNAWSYKTFIYIFIYSSFFIIAGLYLFSHSVSSYVGMSGVLYAIAVYGALITFRSQMLVSSAVLIYVFVKLLADNIVNRYMGVDMLLGDMKVVEDVHIYGAVLGMILYIQVVLRGDTKL